MADRYHNRGMNLINPDKLKFRILLVGLGTIGSWTAVAMEKIGCENMIMFDNDKVATPNIGCQVYVPEELRLLKTDAMFERLNRKENNIDAVNSKIEEYPKELFDQAQLIVNAADSMDTRKFLIENLTDKQTLIDGRMAGNAIEIYTAVGSDPVSIETFKKSLFDSSQARPIPCGMKAVAYNGFVCAGLLTDLVAKYANGEKLPAEILVDLRNLTLFTG